MARIVYRIVQHDGGWAYQLDGAFSETYRSHDAAMQAARRAAAEQKMPGAAAEIEYEDADGKWHSEHAGGHDRPDVDIVE